jgi:Cdc6-like AAA superfamily ATPase
MAEMKGRSPFYPGHPIPPESFTGRDAQIKRIKSRGVNQVANGKPAAIFIQGEYGIGKSSIANYVRAIAEMESGLHGIYVTLGLASSFPVRRYND